MCCWAPRVCLATVFQKVWLFRASLCGKKSEVMIPKRCMIMYLYERALNGKSHERKEEYTEQMNHNARCRNDIPMSAVKDYYLLWDANPPF